MEAKKCNNSLGKKHIYVYLQNSSKLLHTKMKLKANKREREKQG